MTDELFKHADQEDPVTDPLAIAINGVSAETASMKARYDESKALQKLLEGLLVYRDKGWSLHIKALCDRNLERLKKLRESGHPCLAVIEELYRKAKQQAECMPTVIPTDIERLATSAQLEVDRKSRHPRYFFGKDGFIEARVDDQRWMATISTREGKITTMSADPGAILDAVAKESKRLFERKFSGARFLANVRKAYLAAIKARKEVDDGESIPIREIYSQMVKRMKNYKSDEFLVDLSRLVEEGPAETTGYTFNLQQTKDTQEGVLLLGAAGHGMVNLMVFKKSNSLTS